MLLLSIPCSTRLREDGRTLFVPDGGLPERHIHTPQMCVNLPQKTGYVGQVTCVMEGGFRSWRNTHTYLSRPSEWAYRLKKYSVAPHDRISFQTFW
jgi:hypothetical protein